MNITLYEAAQTDALWRDMTHFGRFSVSGKDAAQLLHHMTTNDIKGLKDGQSCEAALITSKARMLDLISVFRRDHDFLIVTSPNRREMFAPHLRSFVLYRQDVHIEDETESGALFGLFGNGRNRVLDLGDLASSQVQNVTKNGATFQVAPTTRLPLNGVFVQSDSRDALTQFVRESGVPLCDNETYNVLRVESGVPATGLELTEDVNPWEAGLEGAISLNKGCYNGQEIVARLNTYQKVKRSLRGLKMSGEETSSTKLKADGKDAGFISSRVASPRFGAIALAYVRGDYAESGQQLQVEDSSQSAVVCDLPFGN